MARILIVDDDRMLCDMVVRKFHNLGHQTDCAHTIKDGIETARRFAFDIVLLDVRLPDGSGIEEIPSFISQQSQPELIIITGEGDPGGAKIAIETGAWDYIEKPLSMREIVLQLNQALLYREEKNKHKGVTLLDRSGIIGSDPVLQGCLQQLALIAPTDTPVIITGETGTGKELFARAVHANSRRRDKTFVVLDCAAFPENLVESMLFGHVKGAFTGADRGRDGLILEADGGTLFLDEVGELPLTIQKTFLRVLQEHTFRPVGGVVEKESDFRLVAATNRDLDEMVQTGGFREDLLYRLRASSLKLPPLRERKSDIETLALNEISSFCSDCNLGIKGVSKDFLAVLREYPWPGNVRELIHAVDSAVGTARLHDTLFPKHLPAAVRINTKLNTLHDEPMAAQVEELSDREPDPLCSLKESLEAAEEGYLKKLLAEAGGDIQQCCRISGLSRSGLYLRLKKYGLSRDS